MYKVFIIFGKILKFFNIHRLLNYNEYNNSIRVFYTHEIDKKHYLSFKKIIEDLIDKYSVIDPKEFFACLGKGKSIRGQNILFTFDDGFLSSYNFVKKVLNPLNVKTIFFVPTAILDFTKDSEMKNFVNKNIYYNESSTDSFINNEYKLMNKSHLLDLTSDGHMIFPHTHNHIFINSINNQEMVNKELIDPQKIIKNITGQDLRVFAFPVGTLRQVNKFSYDQVKKHYDYIFTAYSGLTTSKTDKNKIFRSNLPAYAIKSYVEMVMDGVYDIYYKFKMNRISKIIDN